MQPKQRPPGGGGRPLKKGGGCASCCCCCCSFIFFLFFVLSAIIAIFYFWFDPKPPSFDLKSMEIPRYGISRNPDGGHLYVRTEAQVEVKNPNRMLGISYGETRLTVAGGADGGINLGEGKAEGFRVAPGEAKTLTMETETPTDGELVNEAEELELKEGFESGELAVTVEVESSVGLVVKGLETGKFSVRINCPSAKLKQLQGDDDMPKCSVTVFKCINKLNVAPSWTSIVMREAP